MNEFLTQPFVPLGGFLILSVLVILIDIARRIERWQLERKIETLQWRMDNMVTELESISETNWGLEDDVERLPHPWWKRLLRK